MIDIIDEKDYLDKEQYDEVKNALDEAQESTEPFLAVANDGKELSVIGDADKTEKKVKTYDVLFRFPSFMEVKNNDSENVKVIKEMEKGNFVYKIIRFSNVFLAPRHDLEMVSAISKLMPFFNKLMEDGGLEELTEEEALGILGNMNSEMIDAMYGVVCIFLGLNDEFKDFITINSMVQVFAELIKDFPAVFNEADIFFG